MKTKILLFSLLMCFGGLGLQAQTLGDENDNGLEKVEVKFTFMDTDNSRRIEVPALKGWMELKFRNGTIGAIRVKLDGRRYGFNKASSDGSGYQYYYLSRGSEKYKVGINENVSEGGGNPGSFQGQHDVVMTIMYDSTIIK